MIARLLVSTAVLASAIALAQSLPLPDPSTPNIPETDGVYQVRYVSNIGVSSPVINLMNVGTKNGFQTSTRLCFNIYAFDSAAELTYCCACPSVPDRVVSVFPNIDLLIPFDMSLTFHNSIVVKVVSTIPGRYGVCNAATPSTGNLARGMRAWATSVHLDGTHRFQETETPFSNAELSPSELGKLTTYCGFLQSDGAAAGICRSCYSHVLEGK